MGQVTLIVPFPRGMRNLAGLWSQLTTMGPSSASSLALSTGSPCMSYELRHGAKRGKNTRQAKARYSQAVFHGPTGANGTKGEAEPIPVALHKFKRGGSKTSPFIRARIKVIKSAAVLFRSPKERIAPVRWSKALSLYQVVAAGSDPAGVLPGWNVCFRPKGW